MSLDLTSIMAIISRKWLDRKRRKMGHGGRAIPATEHHGVASCNGVTVKDVELRRRVSLTRTARSARIGR